MNKSKLQIGFLTVGVCLVSFGWAINQIIRRDSIFDFRRTYAQQRRDSVHESRSEIKEWPESQNVQEDALARVSKLVAEFGQSKNLDGLIELENSVNSSVLKNDIGLYTELMIKICGGFNTYHFENPKQYIYARRCAKNALTRLDEMPIGRATNLVAQLGGDNEYILQVVPENQWKQDRTERAKYWFRAWELLNNAVIKNYDFEANRPVYHDKMTEQERTRAEQYNQQRFLQRDTWNYLTDFRRFIIDSYSKPPYDNAELERYLNKYVADASLRQELSAQVEHKIASRGIN